MRCTHEKRVLFLASCTHPNVHTPNDSVWPEICRSCRFNDNGARNTKPKRLGLIPRGLGDTANDLLKVIGIEKKRGCGCSQRQSWLNQAVSYERLPSLAREGKTWANWLCKLLRIKTGMEPQRILFRFPHGFGDAVQFTGVLRQLRKHYPQNRFAVVCKHGAETLFTGLAETFVARTPEDVWAFQPGKAFDFDTNIDWWEPDTTYADSPGTKIEKCLREAFGMTPEPTLNRYSIQTTTAQRQRAKDYLRSIDATGRAVVFHYQGNTARQNKTLNEQIVRKMVQHAQGRGFVPIVLDFDNRSCYSRHPQAGVHVPPGGHELWGGEHGTGCGGTMAALINRSRLMLGIDSGPGHVAGATGTPTLIAWRRHHPVNYYCTAENVTHIVTAKHTDYIKGDRETGEKFFAENYRHIVADRNYRVALPEIFAEALAKC